MFIFYFLGVRLPCRLIFCQFWLCEEVQCVYLRRHLGSLIMFLICMFLMDNYAELFFFFRMSIGHLCMFSLEKCLFRSFAHFLIGLFVLLLLSFVSTL